jgi:hypothetical protein
MRQKVNRCSGIQSSDPAELFSLGVSFTLEASYGEENLSVTHSV